MSWVQQGNRFYYYHSYRQGKKVITEYWGKDDRITHIKVDWHNLNRPHKPWENNWLTIAQDCYKHLYTSVDIAIKNINTLLKRVLIFTGHHIDHKGIWRKAHIKTVLSKRYKLMIKGYLDNDKDFDYRKIILRKAVEEFRQSILEYPEMWKKADSLSEVALMDLITTCCYTNESRQKACELVDQLMQDLNHNKATQLEKLLIDAIILTKLKVVFMERNVAVLDGNPSKSSKYWEQKQNQAVNQHLKACHTLAKVKKLAKHCTELKSI